MNAAQKCALGIIAIVMMSAHDAYAVACLGTKMPEKHRWFWGAEINVLAERKLDRHHGKMRSADYFAIASYALADWFCLDGKIGVGGIRYRSDDYDADYDTDFAGGYGFRIKLWDREGDPFKAVCGFQHISVHPDAAYVGVEKKEAIIDDWQGSVVFSYDLTPRLVPYVGAKFSECDLIEWTDGERTRKKSRHGVSWGLSLGCDVYIMPDIWCSFEGRFFDEKALSCAIRKGF